MLIRRIWYKKWIFLAIWQGYVKFQKNWSKFGTLPYFPLRVELLWTIMSLYRRGYEIFGGGKNTLLRIAMNKRDTRKDRQYYFRHSWIVQKKTMLVPSTFHFFFVSFKYSGVRSRNGRERRGTYLIELKAHASHRYFPKLGCVVLRRFQRSKKSCIVLIMFYVITAW